MELIVVECNLALNNKFLICRVYAEKKVLDQQKELGWSGNHKPTLSLFWPKFLKEGGIGLQNLLVLHIFLTL